MLPLASLARCVRSVANGNRSRVNQVGGEILCVEFRPERVTDVGKVQPQEGQRERTSRETD